MKSLLLIPLFLSLASCAAFPKPNRISYSGHKVFRIKTQHQLNSVLKKLSSLSFDQWNHDITRHIDIAISPDQLAKFEALGLDAHCMHEDLGASIAAESRRTSVWKRQVNDSSWYNTYHPYEDHKQYFNDLQASFPDNSETISSGTSYEGRDIFGIHLWGAEGPGKPAVLWHGTVHAREWITAMVVEYLTLQLIQGYGNDNVTTSFLDKYDFYILPFVNPDGFVHSQTTERLWRKNRQPPPPSGNSSCFGRDINRNWPYEWNSNPLGASTDPCSQTYKGEEPSDTPENQGLVKLVNELRDSSGIKLFIDWHSYGQYILSPWGYNCTLYADDLGQHTKLAAVTGDAIRETEGKTFTFGPSCSTLYATTGSSVDYIYGAGKADWAYTIELRDVGDFGFVLPPEQIRPSVEEQWLGQRVMLSLLDEVFFDGEGPAASAWDGEVRND
ncbi:zinc carboxypeptidase [Zopfia rhizophila CBS 207.26]|uniref:Zinc carboxypeptidase n=1 Tax=Zopfia rhizophila CBS 207.26 TaxID=1314779 RepID=A0A6A6DDQ8_9PEZI|nr:zinc carboxypeptidase [Zopfia rhizophila CBS 207.26]